MSQNLIVEDGRIIFPPEVVGRYGLEDNTPLRIIETRHGILLIPLTENSMSEALRHEIEDWQELGNETLAAFPYESDEE